MLKSAPGYEDQYKTLKNRKNIPIDYQLLNSWICLIFRGFTKNFQNFWTDLVRKTLFLFFEQNFPTLLALGFWQNLSFFMEKVTFFQNFKKKLMFWRKHKATVIFIFEKQANSWILRISRQRKILSISSIYLWLPHLCIF